MRARAVLLALFVGLSTVFIGVLIAQWTALREGPLPCVDRFPEQAALGEHALDTLSAEREWWPPGIRCELERPDGSDQSVSLPITGAWVSIGLVAATAAGLTLFLGLAAGPNRPQ